ncbi:hypothetical protein [Lacticaseibacillus jixiensis]|uniref:hypothetical protein n=1 Tax=Lacticaseibacillus jixiensis TaxID=3231926 RepID=UPI0036F44B73
MEKTAEPTAVATADEALNKNGFVTEKDVPELSDMEYARDLSEKLTQRREKKNEHGYIYTEPFDYVGGKISNIVWNFDKVPSREDAETDLGKAMGWQEVKPQLSAADQETF